jgi:hypothetical protein
VQTIPYELRPRRRTPTLHEHRTWQRASQLAEVDGPVAFEVDYHANDFRIAWSVLMKWHDQQAG